MLSGGRIIGLTVKSTNVTWQEVQIRIVIKIVTFKSFTTEILFNFRCSFVQILTFNGIESLTS